MILKTCPDCGLAKSLQQFADNRARPDGKAFYCRDCFNVRSAATYRRKRARDGFAVRERREVPSGQKFCPSCQSVKPIEQFHLAPKQSGGRASYCAPCKLRQEREARLLKLYGLTAQKRDELVAAQGGLCALCRELPAEHVDHDHVTDEVRGVLCFRCNVGIGHFRDRADLARRAADYLETTTWQRTQVCTGVYRLTSPRPAARRSASSSGMQRLICSHRAGISQRG